LQNKTVGSRKIMLSYYRSKLLIDGTGSAPIQEAAILVRDGVIDAVGPASQIQAPSMAEQIDLGELTILPGLIDAHVHLFGTPEPGGFLATQNESEEWLLLRACSNIRLALACGLTTIRDCGSRGTIILSLAKAITGGIVPGSRVVACGAPITTTAGHCYYLGLEADGMVEVQKAVRGLHKQGVDFIKVMVTGGGITRGSNSNASQYSQEELTAIVEDAHRLGKRVAGHMHGTQGIQRAVDAGFDTIEHGSWLALNGNGRDYDPRVVEKIIRKGIIVCRTTAGFERVPLEKANPECELWPAFEVFRNMVRDGVKLAAGTDSGIDYTPIDGYVYTLETMAGLGGMSNNAVLLSATKIAAEAVGLSSHIGTLEKGKQADLIAVSGNPLDDLRVLRNVKWVIKSGKMVAKDGKILE
jgi:imidazolonepropionase-like amidohydrolase